MRAGVAYMALLLASVTGTASAQYLSVSAANPVFGNHLTGPQVVGVVVTDPSISSTTTTQSMPDVTVDGKRLTMVQGDDGSWYAYFADRNQALRADSTAPGEGSAAAGNGLDFGTFCDSASENVLGLSLSGIGQTRGFAIPTDEGVDGGTAGAPLGSTITWDCIGPASGPAFLNVVRAPPSPSAYPGAPTDVGQIGIVEAAWPFIQLYLLAETGTVEVKYNRPGGTETILLTFDSVESYADAIADRSSHPPGADVHLTITDPWLNIDPTSRDSWTFGSNPSDPGSFGSYYQLFDETGTPAGDGVAGGAIRLDAELASLMCEDNCSLSIDPDPPPPTASILTLRDNDITEIVAADPEDIETWETSSGQLPAGSYPITLLETDPNSSIFTIADLAGTSNLKLTEGAPRGTAATYEYSANAASVLVANFTGSIFADLAGDWQGQEIDIFVFDQDMNENSLVAETLSVADPRVDHVPSLRVGAPVTLESLVSARLEPAGIELLDGNPATEDVEALSDRVFLRNTTGGAIPIDDGDELRIQLGLDLQALYAAVPEPGTDSYAAGPAGFRGSDFLHFDLRSLFAAIDSLEDVTIAIADSTDQVVIATDASSSAMIDLAAEALVPPLGFFDLEPTDPVQLSIILNTSGPATIATEAVLPIVVDFFSFGFFGSASQSEKVVDMIVRLETVESGPNTGLFLGSMSFEMHDQLSVLDPQTHAALIPTGDVVHFVLGGRAVDPETLAVEFIDVLSTGNPVVRSDELDAPTHAGGFSIGASAVLPGEVVTLSLADADLNDREDVIERFEVVGSTYENDPAFGAIGAPGLPDDLPIGALGVLGEITLDSERWRSPQGSCDLSGVPDAGLDATGLVLVETSADSGIFEGSFRVPWLWCRGDDGAPEPTSGLTMGLRYVDFRHSSLNGVVGSSLQIPVPEPNSTTSLGVGLLALAFCGTLRRRLRLDPRRSPGSRASPSTSPSDGASREAARHGRRASTSG